MAYLELTPDCNGSSGSRPTLDGSTPHDNMAVTLRHAAAYALAARTAHLALREAA